MISYTVGEGMPARHVEQVDDPRLMLAEWTRKNEPARYTGKQGKSKLPQIQILDVGHLSGFTLRGGDYYGPSPTHGSKAGLNNIHVSPGKNLWKCFACDSGGDGWYWLAVNERIIPCWEAKPKRLVGETFKRTRQRAIELGLIEKTEPQGSLSERILHHFGAASTPTTAGKSESSEGSESRIGYPSVSPALLESPPYPPYNSPEPPISPALRSRRQD